MGRSGEVAIDGQTLRLVRTNAFMDRQELCQESKLSYTTICRIEQSGTPVMVLMKTAKALARALGVHPRDLSTVADRGGKSVRAA